MTTTTNIKGITVSEKTMQHTNVQVVIKLQIWLL